MLKFLSSFFINVVNPHGVLECYSAAHCGMQLDDKEIQYRSSHAMHFESK